MVNEFYYIFEFLISPDKPTTNETEEVKTSKTEKWFSTKLNKGFFQGLSFSQDLSSSQVPQIFIITLL
jgi:hypothetical protein